jgi:PAS domain S-box-containing protein
MTDSPRQRREDAGIPLAGVRPVFSPSDMSGTDPSVEVLIVEQRPRSLAALRETLEPEFTVLAARAEDALAALEQRAPAVMVCPETAGRDFLKAASERSPATQIVLARRRGRRSAPAAGEGLVYSYIEEPWDPKLLRVLTANAAAYSRLYLKFLRERDLLRALMESIPDRIYFKDSSCRYTHLNHAQARLLGISDPESARGKTVCDFSSEPWAREALLDEEKIVRTGSPLIDKVETVRRPNGEVRWFSTTKAPILDAAGRVTGIVGVSRDISERRRAVESLARQADELARYDAELERFAFVSAHDLQEPLRTMASFAQLLAIRYRGKLGADADQYIEMIISGAARMRALLEDLLTYSRLARRQPGLEPVHTERVFQRALARLEGQIKRAGAIVTCDPLPVVQADPARLELVFQNLLGNAVKFRAGARPRIHVSAARNGTEWIFSVRDNGIGIEAQHFTRIFLIFERLHSKQEYAGSGVGLAICKRIVEGHRGRIWVESEPGKGSTFYFTIPILEEAQQAGAAS